MILASLERRLAKAEHRLRHRARGLHRYSDAELDSLIAWLHDPDPAAEPWVIDLLRREGLVP